MSTSKKLSTAEAAARLGVQRASLYAYVSRGMLSRSVASDGRSSLFDSDEVDRLARRVRRGRPALGNVDVLLSTGLTRISDEGVWYRGRSLATLVDSWTFEQAATWLWTGDEPSVERWPVAAEAPATGGSPSLVLLQLLTRVPEATDLAAVGRAAIAMFADNLPRSGRVRRATDQRIAARVSARLGRPDLTDLVDAVLVMLADHELASSTLAARIAASTRAGAHGVIAAGLGVLSGPLHGAAGKLVHELLADARRIGVERAIDVIIDAGGRVPGFGHAVYRSIDPRAALLFDRLRVAGLMPEVAEGVVAEVAKRKPGIHPNLDMALGAFTTVAELPASTCEYFFGIARTAGWIAHALEEYDERPVRFRPRSVYVGR